jgi:hypothetical protein
MALLTEMLGKSVTAHAPNFSAHRLPERRSPFLGIPQERIRRASTISRANQELADLQLVRREGKHAQVDAHKEICEACMLSQNGSYEAYFA